MRIYHLWHSSCIELLPTFICKWSLPYVGNSKYILNRKEKQTMVASRGKRERKKKKKERKKEKCAANQEPKENQKRVCRQLRFKRLLYFI
jgi:hypothetical protein